MPELLQRCTVCRALLDEEDLFCANCGTEAPHDPDAAAADQPEQTVHKHRFTCSGCGAAMSYDASSQSLRCPFCGSEKLEQSPDGRELAAQGVVPFLIDQPAAEAALTKWLGSSFWRPSDLANRAEITKIAPVYVPYWMFHARTRTYWSADTNHTPRGARGDWYPLTGHHQGDYRGVLISASSVLSPAETFSLLPFDLNQIVAPSEVDLENAIVEEFRAARKYARPLARSRIEELERDACAGYVPGSSRNVKVNVLLDGLTSQPILLPVWIMAYRYKGEVYRFLLNDFKSFDSLFKVLFIFPSQYLFAIGFPYIFSLRRSLSPT